MKVSARGALNNKLSWSVKQMTLLKIYVMPMMLAALLTLTSCARTTVIEETDKMCVIFKPVTWETSDTDKTIYEVKQHNAVWDNKCKRVK